MRNTTPNIRNMFLKQKLKGEEAGTQLEQTTPQCSDKTTSIPGSNMSSIPGSNMSSIPGSNISTSKPQKEKEHQQVYPIFMKMKDQKVAKTDRNESQKQKAGTQRKVENMKEKDKGARAMEAWLKTGKVRQSLGSQTDAHRDGAEGQIIQMATQGGDTRKSNADLSDEARVCRTNPSTEKKIAGRTELTKLKIEK